jgi:hypothetical protein
MDNIVDKVIHSYDQKVPPGLRKKVSNYFSLLKSAGKTDEELITLGRAYLKEHLEPDTRFSGCWVAASVKAPTQSERPRPSPAAAGEHAHRVRQKGVAPLAIGSFRMWFPVQPILIVGHIV